MSKQVHPNVMHQYVYRWGEEIEARTKEEERKAMWTEYLKFCVKTKTPLNLEQWVTRDVKAFVIVSVSPQMETIYARDKESSVWLSFSLRDSIEIQNYRTNPNFDENKTTFGAYQPLVIYDRRHYYWLEQKCASSNLLSHFWFKENLDQKTCQLLRIYVDGALSKSSVGERISEIIADYVWLP